MHRLFPGRATGWSKMWFAYEKIRACYPWRVERATSSFGGSIVDVVILVSSHVLELYKALSRFYSANVSYQCPVASDLASAVLHSGPGTVMVGAPGHTWLVRV